jgi:hypothetical protein
MLSRARFDAPPGSTMTTSSRKETAAAFSRVAASGRGREAFRSYVSPRLGRERTPNEHGMF